MFFNLYGRKNGNKPLGAASSQLASHYLGVFENNKPGGTQYTYLNCDL
jgi:hypothetical protein